mgnify:CR=1 FL=1|tara:strand:- start:175 stop:2418 length:2244 start_codon:yes stop_codon:yes gene_type:complete
MNKNEIKNIILEEIKDALEEMNMSPEMMAADSRPEEDDFAFDKMDGEMYDDGGDPMEEMARTSNIFKLKDGAGLKDVMQFMQRVNDVLKTYKSPGQKRPKKRFTPEEMKTLAMAMLKPEGFTSKDVIAATSYTSPAQANKFLAALEQKGLITITSILKKSLVPDRDPNAPETRGRKAQSAEFDMSDDPLDMDFGDFDNLDLSDPTALYELSEGRFGNVIQSLTQDISKAQDEGDNKMVSILKSYLPKLKRTQDDEEIESLLNDMDTQLAREFGESFDIVGSYLAEGKQLKENTITGEYEGKPVKFKIKDIEGIDDILNRSKGAKDFVNKLSMAVTDETSSLSKEDTKKVILFYKNQGKELKGESIDKEFHSTSVTSQHPNPDSLSAEEIEAYINANKKTLFGRSLRMYKMVLNNKKKELKENNNMSNNLTKHIRRQILEAKNPLAAKLKEIEAQGTIAALESKLAAVQEIIEETNERLTRIDEDSEFTEMMDKGAVKGVRKQLKELERAHAKIQKEYDKAISKSKGGAKKETVVDEDMGGYEMQGGGTDADGYEEAPVGESVRFEGLSGIHDLKPMVTMNESLLRMQKLAGLITEGEFAKKLSLNENFPIVFIGNGKVSNVLGNDAKSEENSASFQSIANGGAVILQVEYMWKGEGVLQLFVKVGDENKISYKHSDNVDESKVISFIEDVKPEIKRALENKIKQSDVKEYLGKIHIGSGYKDKIVDEDVAKVKAGIENFNTIKPSKV